MAALTNMSNSVPDRINRRYATQTDFS